MPPDHRLRQAELLPDASNLVLEQRPQRLDQLHGHVVRQAADVVVRLDLRRDALAAARLDHVGVERPLDEKAGAADPGRLLLEDPDELLPHPAALLLGIGDAVEPREEARRCLDVHERDVEAPVEGLDHLGRLVLSEQAVVDEDAGQPVADRLVHEQRGDGRVDAAGERRRAPARARPAPGSARSAPRSPPPASTPAARPRPRRGSSSAGPGRAACARPPDGTGRRRGRARAPRRRRSASRAELAVTSAPGGRRGHRVAVAHPDGLARPGSPRPSRDPGAARSSARPNSDAPVRSTRPPSSCAISCIP